MGMEEYGNAMVKVVSEQFRSVMDDERKAFRNNIKRLMYNDKSLPEITIPLSEENAFLEKMFKGFNEIYHSYHCMKNVETYISRNPYSVRGIPRSEFLKYHHENYLNEFYTLKKRMVKYVDAIKKNYKCSRQRLSVEASLSKTSKAIEERFKEILSIRHDNVHTEKRTDFGMTQLEMFELLADNPDSEIDKWMRDSIYRATRKEKLEWIRKQNIQVKKGLDAYFDVLRQYVFSKSGQILYPEKAP